MTSGVWIRVFSIRAQVVLDSAMKAPWHHVHGMLPQRAHATDMVMNHMLT